MIDNEINNVKPLIYTTMGNVPESSLNYTQEWEDHIIHDISLLFDGSIFKPKVKKDGHMLFIERYHDKETGELVKENRHVCLLGGLELKNDQGMLE